MDYSDGLLCSSGTVFACHKRGSELTFPTVYTTAQMFKVKIKKEKMGKNQWENIKIYIKILI